MDMPLTDRSLIQRAPGTVETALEEEIVLMKLATGECIGMGPTGSAIWRLSEHPTRIADLVRQLEESFDAPAGVIAQDVAEFVVQMQSHGLVEVS